MRDSKRMITDLLFVVQIICTVIFCGAYTIRATHDVRGSSIAQFGLVLVYLVFQIELAIGAHRAAPSRLSKQSIGIYTVWIVLMSSIVVATLANPSYHWNIKDTSTCVSAAVLTAVVLAIRKMRRLPFGDPLIKACFAIAYKAMPQLILAWKFLTEGGSGTPAASVIVGHVTILLRIAHTGYLVREAGWDRNRLWLIASEAANEFSWAVATVAWLIVR